ncbi:hypothetical protein [Botrimarina colliarenosi]|nr:hypothetical protein [Botrimarina colliarenosi]
MFRQSIGLTSLLLWTGVGVAETATWSEPAIDSWSYTNGFGGGFRAEAPTFGGLGFDSETAEFGRGSQTGPTRLGSMLLAFETDDSITPLLDARRYAIQSVTVTVQLKASSGSALPYGSQPITPEALVAEAVGGGVTSQKPFELFGVGFRGGFDGFALGPDQSGVRFSESTNAYASGVGYVVYPAIGDDESHLVDVSNNLTGGFSATAPGNETDPFAATPWSIGDPGVAEGEAIADNTVVTFDVDLTQPGALDYLQQSLAAGSLGFFLSSAHAAGQQGAGGSAYPVWYTKEAAGVFTGAEAPTLTIDYAILPIAGDYDGNGVVEPADYDAWSASYGLTVDVAGTGSDGNADGVIDAADYTVWRDALPAAPLATAVPEPSNLALGFIGFTLLGFYAPAIRVSSKWESME